jgi:2-dehydro-3-deoxygalactonokinase
MPMQSYLALDVGTTHTRAWLVADDVVLAEQRAAVGVRDTARDGSNVRLRTALAEIIHALERDPDRARRPILASGMIGSSLGLRDVPHVRAPADLHDLAAGMQPVSADDVVARPIWIVPGVRTIETGTAGQPGDVMRGEETLCLGALARGLLRPGDTLVSIGSHWKRIAIDASGRVAASRSSLGGEIVDAVKSTTVIAEAVPQGWPSRLPDDAVARGVALCHRVGLPRALFQLRLDQLAGTGTPADRLAMLVGVVIGADLADWVDVPPDGRLVVAGASPVADAWAAVLDTRGRSVTRITTADAEHAQRAGLQQIALRAGVLT